ncbi:uncharacterized protein METZ01_LOCUS375031 [marine metagenome]|uniref:Glycosyltransferase 2-like domain-containing protein n=1 Tax=marine metagenome TaxID=408172 RepID=A0A382TL11_9ZZZZ
MEEYDLTVLLIAYNEENFLENCVKEVIQAVTPLRLKYEILIVENGSSDNTFNIAKKLSDEFPFIVAVHLDRPSGTNAIRKGYSIARGNIVANLDVDLSTDMSYFNELIEHTKNYDIVTGSRYLDPSIVKRTFDRHYMSMIYNRVFIRGLLGSKILDNGCGFRAVKREIGKELYDKINDNGFFGPNEFLIRAQRKEYTIKEFPVKWSENYRRIGPWQILVTLLIPLTKLWINLTFRKNQ